MGLSCGAGGRVGLALDVLVPETASQRQCRMARDDLAQARRQVLLHAGPREAIKPAIDMLGRSSWDHADQARSARLEPVNADERRLGGGGEVRHLAGAAPGDNGATTMRACGSALALGASAPNPRRWRDAAVSRHHCLDSLAASLRRAGLGGEAMSCGFEHALCCLTHKGGALYACRREAQALFRVFRRPLPRLRPDLGDIPKGR